MYIGHLFLNKPQLEQQSLSKMDGTRGNGYLKNEIGILNFLLWHSKEEEVCEPMGNGGLLTITLLCSWILLFI